MSATNTAPIALHGPQRELLLLPFGLLEFDRPMMGPSGPLLFDLGQAAELVAAHRRQAAPLAIDYEHQSFAALNRRADGQTQLAGEIGDLEVRHDGLWATHVQWLPQAAAFLRGGEYRYISPTIFVQHGRAVSLGPAALTNDPAMSGGGELIAATRKVGDMAIGSTSGATLANALRGFDYNDSEAVREFIDTLGDEAAFLIRQFSRAVEEVSKMAGGANAFRRSLSPAERDERSAYRRLYAASPALQEEFGDADTYAAYRWAVARGR